MWALSETRLLKLETLEYPNNASVILGTLVPFLS